MANAKWWQPEQLLQDMFGAALWDQVKTLPMKIWKLLAAGFNGLPQDIQDSVKKGALRPLTAEQCRNEIMVMAMEMEAAGNQQAADNLRLYHARRQYRQARPYGMGEPYGIFEENLMANTLSSFFKSLPEDRRLEVMTRQCMLGPEEFDNSLEFMRDDRWERLVQYLGERFQEVIPHLQMAGRVAVGLGILAVVFFFLRWARRLAVVALLLWFIFASRSFGMAMVILTVWAATRGPGQRLRAVIAIAALVLIGWISVKALLPETTGEATGHKSVDRAIASVIHEARASVATAEPGSSRPTTPKVVRVKLLGKDTWSEPVDTLAEAPPAWYGTFCGPSDARVRFPNGAQGPITKDFGVNGGRIRFDGPAGQEARIVFSPVRAPTCN